MKKALTAGILLGLIVFVWDFVYGFLGLYRNPIGGGVFIVVAILAQVGVLIWGLKQTLKDGKRYWGQVGAGLVILVVSGVLIVIASFAFTAAFPEVLDLAAEQQAEQFAQQGMNDEEVEDMLEKMSFTRSPAFMAVMGLVGHMFTGVIATLIIAAVVRIKD